VVPGRMGRPGSCCWMLNGIALLRVARRRPLRLVMALALFTAGVSGLSILGYLYHADEFYTLPKLTDIALQTATFIMSLSFAY